MTVIAKQLRQLMTHGLLNQQENSRALTIAPASSCGRRRRPFPPRLAGRQGASSSPQVSHWRSDADVFRGKHIVL